MNESWSQNWNSTSILGTSEVQYLCITSGKHSYGKSPFFNGKTHYKWPFSIAMLVYQRVVQIVLLRFNITQKKKKPGFWMYNHRLPKWWKSARTTILENPILKPSLLSVCTVSKPPVFWVCILVSKLLHKVYPLDGNFTLENSYLKLRNGPWATPKTWLSPLKVLPLGLSSWNGRLRFHIISLFSPNPNPHQRHTYLVT